MSEARCINVSRCRSLPPLDLLTHTSRKAMLRLRYPIVLICALLPVALSPSSSQAAKAKEAKAKEGKAKPIKKASFAKAVGKPVDLYTLTNAKGAVAKITNYGAIVTELHVPDRDGKMADVVLGFDNVDDYVKKSPYFGAIVGRVANRIKDATFVLDGKTYKLNANAKPHHLHGGTKGWDKAIWTAEPSQTKAGPSLKLTHVSPDGDEGYPGTVTAPATYTLTNDDQLQIEMQATSDRPTLISMAHHGYWNLAGGGTIRDHELTIPADRYTPGN